MNQTPHYRWISLCYVLVLSLSSSCSAPQEKLNQGKLANVPLVFIHGIKGAELKNASDDLMWVDVWTGLGFKTPDLALPLSWDGAATVEMQTKDSIFAVGILESIPVVPLLYKLPIYSNWLSAVRKTGRPFYPFYYDWRRDNLETVSHFQTFLRKVYEKEGRPIQVVAHSMGGLVTLPVLNKNPEIFHSVVFAGVPFVGGIGFLPDLSEAHPTGLNSSVFES